MGLFGVRLLPLEGLRIDLSNQWGVNTFNTIYAEADYLRGAEDWKLRFGTQFTDQRAVGDALLPVASGQLLVHPGWRLARPGDLRESPPHGRLLDHGRRQYHPEHPGGAFPGYLSLIDQDFDRPGRRRSLIGAAYDFSTALTRGLSGNSNIGYGWGAINPSTREKAPDQAEYDFTTDYRPPFNLPLLQGMWFRCRSAILDQQDAKTLGYQFRISSTGIGT